MHSIGAASLSPLSQQRLLSILVLCTAICLHSACHLSHQASPLVSAAAGWDEAHTAAQGRTSCLTNNKRPLSSLPAPPPLDDLQSCLYTFQQIRDAPVDSCYTAGGYASCQYAMSKCCPAGCLSLVRSLSNGTGSPAAVYGSFPYHGKSSICLAAIHSGLITDEQGGWVFYDAFSVHHQPLVLDLTDPDADSARFVVDGRYQRVLANMSGLELFPYNSSLPSLSNGVQSLHAAAAYDYGSSSLQLPNVTVADFSYTVHGRGSVVSAVSHPPFDARAGHVHVFNTMYVSADMGSDRREFYLVIGGRNATHYKRDVWLGERVAAAPAADIDGLMQPWQSSVQWFRLPDAPFSGRAYMGFESWACVRFQPMSNCRRLGAYEQNSTVVLWLYGGQVGHRCQLEHLGVCSREIWALGVSRNWSSPTMGLSFTWALQPVLMPVALCGTLLLPFQLGPDAAVMVAAIGGQASYEDVTCQQPVHTSNTFWYSNDTARAVWQDGGAAPFSPRAWALYDMPLVTTPLQFYSFTVQGGMRILSHTVNASTQVARLTAVEMYADAYTCLYLPPPWTGHEIGPPCAVWIQSDNQSAPAAVTASVPVPAVLSGISDSFSGTLSTTVVGGRSSRAAAQSWLNTAPPLFVFNNTVTRSELVANVTSITQPGLRLTGGGKSLSGASDVGISLSRFGLPLSYMLDEDELNDPEAAFNAGTAWVVTHAYRYYAQYPVLSTAHPQSSQMAQTANGSSLFLYQAASSANTSRGLFDVSLRRHSFACPHQGDTEGGRASLRAATREGPRASLSGGQSGSHWYSDWLQMPTVCCPPPSDPSYRAVLGNGTLVSSTDLNLTETWCVRAGEVGPVTWRCAEGFHLEPPRQGDAREAQLWCAGNGLWVDASVSTVSSCVKDRLHCSFPLVSDDDELCVLPAPTISSVNSSTLVFDQLDLVSCHSSDELTLDDCPLQVVQLSITGSFFSQPLLVLVGGVECLEPQLYDADGQVVCRQDEHNDTDCQAYGSGVLCLMQPVQGCGIPIVLFSGADQQRALSIPLPTVCFAPPRITNMSSSSCVSDSLTRLHSCPYNESFILVVRGDNFWLSLDLPDAAQQPLLALSTFQAVDCRPVPLLAPLTNLSQPHSLECLVSTTAAVPLVTAVAVLMTQREGRSNLQISKGQLAETATISLRRCPVGTEDVGPAQRDIQPSLRCHACGPGFSTEGQGSSQTACLPCPLGTFAAGNGSSSCSACPVNFFGNSTQLSACYACPPNSYQLLPQQSSCTVCDLNQYLVMRDSGPQCENCPPSDSAHCLPNGTILSGSASSYLIVDQSSGLVSSAQCKDGRCLGSAQCEELGGSPSSTTVSLTSLSVVNCCAVHRLPAAVNPLCAHCESGYVEWGDCVQCDWQHFSWGLLATTLLLFFLAIWSLHRLPNDAVAATLSISVYFIQMTLLFFSPAQLPQLLSLFNLDWLGSMSYRGVCLLPLSAINKIVVRSCMPLFALATLVLLFALQKTARLCVRSDDAGVAGKVYWAAFGPAAPSARAEADTGHGSELQHSLMTQSVGDDAKSVNDDSPRPDSAEDEDASGQSTAPRWTRVAPSYIRTVVRLCLYAYNSMAVLCLSYFSCQQVGSDSFLTAYPTISCSSSAYHSMLGVVVALLLTLVIAPLGVLAGLLYSQRQHRRAAGDKVQALQPDPEAEEDRGSGLWRRLTAHFDIVYRAYRPGCYWYAMLILLRRLLLVSIFVFVPASSRAIWLSAANGGILALHAACSPYTRRRDNWLEMATLAALFMQTCVIAATPLPWSGSESPHPAALAMVLLLLVALPVVLILYAASTDLLSSSGRRRCCASGRDVRVAAETKELRGEPAEY